MKQTDVTLILITVPDEATASKISSMLVEQKLAACVNIVPGIRSYFRWHNRLNTVSELLLLVKTRRELFDEVEKSILKYHPYEVPEIIAVEIPFGNEKFINWAKEETQQITG